MVWKGEVGSSFSILHGIFVLTITLVVHEFFLGGQVVVSEFLVTSKSRKKLILYPGYFSHGSPVHFLHRTFSCGSVFAVQELLLFFGNCPPLPTPSL